MSSIRPSPNWLLHTLPEAELEALDSRLELVELVRELPWSKRANR